MGTGMHRRPRRRAVIATVATTLLVVCCGEGMETLLDTGSFPDAEVNRIHNPEFDEGLAGWDFTVYAADGAAATVSIDGEGLLSGRNAASIEIERISASNPPNAYSINLHQDLALFRGTAYELTFMARSRRPKTISVFFEHASGPWTPYWWIDVAVREAPSLFGPFIFRCENDDPGAYLIFKVGGDDTAIAIDRVVLVARADAEAAQADQR